MERRQVVAGGAVVGVEIVVDNSEVWWELAGGFGIAKRGTNFMVA